MPTLAQSDQPPMSKMKLSKVQTPVLHSPFNTSLYSVALSEFCMSGEFCV